MTTEPIDVVTVSLEQAEAQIAEFWVGGVLFAQTLPDIGQLVLRIEPRSDGRPWDVSFRELRRALDRAAELLALQARST
jgi:hypothetical protein